MVTCFAWLVLVHLAATNETWPGRFSVNKKLLAGLAISTLFLCRPIGQSYVYAVQSGHVVSAALGLFYLSNLLRFCLALLFWVSGLDRWTWLAHWMCGHVACWQNQC